MHYLGFSKNALQWFRDYLTDRKQMIDLDRELSETIPMKLGVPQGSILGPILFLIYVNDINKCNTNATYNKLGLNPSKMRYMIFNHKTEVTNLVKIGEEYIERVWNKGTEKSFKLVGIWVDESLKWTEHINAVGKKMNHALYGLTKASKQLSSDNKKLLYSGLIHSHLVYGLPIWSFAAKGRLEPLKIKQKKAIRNIYNLKYREHTNQYFIQSEILKVSKLIEHLSLIHI